MRAVFHENNKHYPQVFLDECLYELWIMNNMKMPYFERTDVCKRIDINKTNASKECNVCHYWHFLDKGMSTKYLQWMPLLVNDIY